MLIFGGSGKSSVGLDIGSHSVKVVELVRSGKGIKLNKYAIVELPHDTVVDGEVVNRDHLVESIKDALTKSGIKTKTVNSAVSGRSVIVRRIPMEKMTEAQARQAIHWEAEQHIPFRVDEVSIDFKILNEESAPGQMEVLLVAAKKEIIHLHRSLVQGAGIKSASVDLEQFALLRAYENSYHPSDDECVTILNVGADNTNLVITKGGVPSFNRDIAMGGGRFVEAIQRSLVGVDLATAEGILRGELPEGVSEAEVKNAVSSVMEELSTSVRRSFISFQASGESSRIDKMLISGGCSLMAGLAETLSEQHGLPVEPFNVFGDIQLEGELLSDESTRHSTEAVIAVAVGLALKSLEPGSLNIDILPVEEKAKKTRKSSSDGSPILTVLSWAPLGLIVVGVVVLFVHYSGLTNLRDELDSEIAQKDTEIASMQEQLSRQQELDVLEAQLNSKRYAIDQLSLQQKSTVYVLEYLVRALYPQQVEFAEEAGKSIYLTELSLGEGILHVSGIARTWGDIVAFQTRIEETRPDGENLLFTIEDYGQNYNVAPIYDAGGGETRYQFSTEIGVNQSSLEPLVSDYAGI
ncbi:MAG: type IV pilus assembly protein PilM [Candidatus Sabulitectum sp.]|nr:type IV pilus assembly protein PilM [Candidatus Sabulitectum sp.]